MNTHQETSSSTAVNAGTSLQTSPSPRNKSQQSIPAVPPLRNIHQPSNLTVSNPKSGATGIRRPSDMRAQFMVSQVSVQHRTVFPCLSCAKSPCFPDSQRSLRRTPMLRIDTRLTRGLSGAWKFLRCRSLQIRSKSTCVDVSQA